MQWSHTLIKLIIHQMYALFGRIPIVANANSTLWPTLNRYYKNLIFKMKSKSLEGLKAMM